MKKETMILHSQIANDMMYYIYEYIDTDINIDQIALNLGINKVYFHKIFKEQIGANIYETIKLIRLQKASNLLISNNVSTVTQIAHNCGYSSVPSFIRAFKKHFNQTPKIWRNGGYKKYSNQILNREKDEFIQNNKYSYLKPTIKRTSSKTIYYIRKKKYNDNTTEIWQKLLTWVYSNNIDDYEQIGIYHDNPIITPIEDCCYVAGISIEKNKSIKNLNLPSFETNADICACFDFEGKNNDILNFIQWVYHSWLPLSGFETTVNPSYIIMAKDTFLEENKLFKVKYYIPIRYL